MGSKSIALENMSELVCEHEYFATQRFCAMDSLINKSTTELVWAKVVFEDFDSVCWSFRSPKQNNLVLVQDRRMEGVNTAGQLLIARLQNNKLVKKPFIIKGSHNESTLIKHFAWVPKDLEHIQKMTWGMLNFFKEPALRDFYYAVLINDELMQKFYKAKASHHHHHSYEGGLLEHSFEVARNAATMSELHGLDHTTTCICFIAGLLHDIGKVKMYYNAQGAAGVCGQHEAFGFLELSQPLNALHKAAPALFEALSGALVAKIGQHKPLYLPETIVRMCDRLSAEVSQCREAFKSMPDYFWYVKSESESRVYKRLGTM